MFLFFLIIGLLGISQNLKSQDTKASFLKGKIDKTKKLNTIHLKNGTTIHGKVIANSQDSLKIRLLSKNQLTFHKDNIQNIDFQMLVYHFLYQKGIEFLFQKVVDRRLLIHPFRHF